ncbi:MAG: hypothetical protein AAGG46_02000, partial [Planctomycetota bacterium]
MPDNGFPSRPSLFSRTLRECRDFYRECGEMVLAAGLEAGPSGGPLGEAYLDRMEDLHRGLVLKLYLIVVEADRKWSKQERFYGEVLCHHLWGEWLSRDALRDTIKQASAESTGLKWCGVLGPFRDNQVLRGRIAELETLVSRLGNLVARCDGDLDDRERQA